MKKTAYIETSIVSYLTARPSRDMLASAWQEITRQWWEQARPHFDIFISELVRAEAAAGDKAAAARRFAAMKNIRELVIDDEVRDFAARLIREAGIPAKAGADALHVAVAAVHEVDYLLTWNCRHIDNAAIKPLIRSVCAIAGYRCPEICTPLELFPGGL